VKTIDFAEIETPERFEYFARDFLKVLGFEIVQGPDRGPEEGRDLIVREMGAITGRATLWLVSCKHKVRSEKAVGVADEPDVLGRISGRADGFMGFYSTPPSSGLTRTLDRLRDRADYYIYDPALIEHFLVSREDMGPLLKQYFPRGCRALSPQATKLRVFTEAGYSLYAKDIAFEFDSILQSQGDALQIADPEFEATVTACYLARQLRSGRYEVLRGIASFNPIVWQVLITLLRAAPPAPASLAAAIRSSNDSLQLRLLISVAGELQSTDTCVDICRRILFDGRRHAAFVRELRLTATPFFDVAKSALSRLGPIARPVVERHAAKAKELGRWVERRVFEAALRLQDPRIVKTPPNRRMNPTAAKVS
jgi:hypothetical protein